MTITEEQGGNTLPGYLQSVGRLSRSTRKPVTVHYMDMMPASSLRERDVVVRLKARRLTRKLVKGRVSKSVKARQRRNRLVYKYISEIQVRLIDERFGAYLVSYPDRPGVEAAPYTHVECIGQKAADKATAQHLNYLHRVVRREKEELCPGV